IQFTGSRSALEGLITGDGTAELHSAIYALLDATASMSGSRHLVCLGSPNPGSQMLATRCAAARVAVHGIATPECENLDTLEKLCRATGGEFHRITSNDELPNALERIYRFLLSNYEISYRTVTDE